MFIEPPKRADEYGYEQAKFYRSPFLAMIRSASSAMLSASRPISRISSDASPDVPKQSRMPTRASGAACFSLKLRDRAAQAADDGMLLGGHRAAGLRIDSSTSSSSRGLMENTSTTSAETPAAGKQVGRFERLVDLDAAGKDRHVGTFAQDAAAAELDLDVLVIDARHRRAAHAHIHRAGRFRGQPDGGLRGCVIGGNEHAHVRKHAHERDVFHHLVASAVGAYRHARMGRAIFTSRFA